MDSGADRDAALPDSARPDVGTDAALCEPVCEGRTCGDDGCGGTCGECDGTCTAGRCVGGERCPPVGPFGTEAGAVAADALLFDCEGNEVRLHDLCAASVSWIIGYADWCSTCRNFTRSDVERLWQEYSAQGVAGYFVIGEDSSFNAPTAEVCAEVRDRYNLTMPVLFDPEGAVQTALGIRSNAENVVLGEGMEILWKARYAESMVPTRLDEALAR